MKPELLLAALVVMSGTGNNFADTIEVNGITSLFGQNIACLVLHQPALTKPLSFALTEGDSQFGIKLLAVDAAHHRVQIEQSGETLYLGICATPELTTTTGAAPVENMEPPELLARATPEERLEVSQFLAQDTDVERINLGNPLAPLEYVGAEYPKNPKATDAPAQPSNSTSASDPTVKSGTANSSNSGGNTATTDSGVPLASSSPSNPSTGSESSNPNSSAAVDYTKQYWYVISVNIEKNRLVTAEQVMNGEMEPLPATPLTPPGTPPFLVGAQTYFANHIAGFPDYSVAD